MSAHTDLLERMAGENLTGLAALAFTEQRRADALQREAAQHQRVADAARKEIKRRKRAPGS